MRIAQLANFVTPTSGGLRTTLRHLADGYARAGHEVLQIVPGPAYKVRRSDRLTQVQLPAPAVPGIGYRVIVDLQRVRDVLGSFGPDAIEVHDRTTLRGLGTWAADNDVRSAVFSHERLDRVVRQWLPRMLRPYGIVDRSNCFLAETFDTVVCATEWAAQEFYKIDADNVRIVPLGVDAGAFSPRAFPRGDGVVRLVMASRLSREKRPDLAVDSVEQLLHRGVPVHLDVCGDGPMSSALRQTSKGLPITWHGHVVDRERLGALMARADVAIAPGPIETFGLAALEAMACGTPAVVNRNSALPGLVGTAGRSAPSSGWCFADQVEDLLASPETARRRAARHQVEGLTWEATVRRFLDLHAHRAGELAA
ncbi:MAG TPA: glycosyltransferase [Mycobacteriales bacterium]|nr:glycosyltransferase [Mycobacteriales bacterium]